MNERVVATALMVGVLGLVYFGAFRVTSARRGTRSRSDGQSTVRKMLDRGRAGSSDGERAESDDPDSDDEEADADDDAESDADDEPAVLRTGPRWNPGTTVALLAGAGGILTKNTTMFLAGVVGFAYAAYQYGTRPPAFSVSVEREISERSPLPSREIEVTLTVRNDGEEPIADLRIVDGVPERLGVVSGSPRHCTSLRAGEEISFTYAVRAQRGTHEFGPTSLVARNVSGSAERRFERETEGRITCETRADDVPLPADTSSHPGHITTDSGGEGVEFYATREYQSADPMSRIDWKRYAKVGELTTVEFRETRSATVMVVVDARTPARVARRAGEPDAVELSEYAAERLAEAFVRRNDRVGLAVFGSAETYLSPGGGDEQVARFRAELDASSRERAPSAGIFDDRRNRANESRFDTLRKRMPDSAQVVFLSPMADDYAVEVAKRFRAYGHAVTVVSPDVTGTDTPGGGVERIERARRLAEARTSEIRVADWSPDDPIRVAVSKATARWSG